MRLISIRVSSPGRIRERLRNHSSVRPKRASGGKGRRFSPPCPCSTSTSTVPGRASTLRRKKSSSVRRTSFENSSAVTEDRGSRKDHPYEPASPHEKYLNPQSS